MLGKYLMKQTLFYLNTILPIVLSSLYPSLICVFTNILQLLRQDPHKTFVVFIF